MGDWSGALGSPRGRAALRRGLCPRMWVRHVRSFHGDAGSRTWRRGEDGLLENHGEDSGNSDFPSQQCFASCVQKTVAWERLCREAAASHGLGPLSGLGRAASPAHFQPSRSRACPSVSAVTAAALSGRWHRRAKRKSCLHSFANPTKGWDFHLAHVPVLLEAAS